MRKKNRTVKFSFSKNSSHHSRKYI